jgi:hypothetical protein
MKRGKNVNVTSSKPSIIKSTTSLVPQPQESYTSLLTRAELRNGSFQLAALIKSEKTALKNLL